MSFRSHRTSILVAASLTLVASFSESALAETSCGREFEIVFVVDVSARVELTEFLDQRLAVWTCVCGDDNQVPADGSVAVAVIQFATLVGTAIPLTLIDSADTRVQLCSSIFEMPRNLELGTATLLDVALDKAKQKKQKP